MRDRVVKHLCMGSCCSFWRGCQLVSVIVVVVVVGGGGGGDLLFLDCGFFLSFSYVFV